MYLNKIKSLLTKKSNYPLLNLCDRKWILKARKAHDIKCPIPLHTDIDVNTER